MASAHNKLSEAVWDQIAQMEVFELNLRDFLKLAKKNPGLLGGVVEEKLPVGCVVVCSTDAFADPENILELGQVVHDGVVELPDKHPDGGGEVNVYVQSWCKTNKMPKLSKLIGRFL